jgi:hypothetical protein
LRCVAFRSVALRCCCFSWFDFKKMKTMAGQTDFLFPRESNLQQD